MCAHHTAEECDAIGSEHTCVINKFCTQLNSKSVSYTHLDVYKRQSQ